MKIGTLDKTSLQDYPGKVSAIIGTQGCNMKCPWCHNFHLIPYDFTTASDIIEPLYLLDFLDQRKSFLDGLVITGGEPTVQKDLLVLCEKVKKMGLSVKLDTNGTNPEMLRSLIDQELVDYIAMDIKTDLDQYHRLLREDNDPRTIIRSIGTILGSGRPYEFRTTCVTPFVTTENMPTIAGMIEGADTYYLQKCRPTQNFLKGGDCQITDDALLDSLKEIAAPYVSTCHVR